MCTVNFIPDLEDFPSSTLRFDDLRRPPAAEYRDFRRKFTERQENFYRNLLAMYRAIDSKRIPVYFTTATGAAMRMDRGCVGMAVNDGFLLDLANELDGTLRYVRLGW